MAVEFLKEAWTRAVNTVAIGAAKEEGGTRASKVCVGGESTLPFIFGEGAMPHKPVVAMEIFDAEPDDWPAPLLDSFGKSIKDPLEWAERCVGEFGAEILCLTLSGAHTDGLNRSPSDGAALVKAILKKVTVPLIITGCGDEEKDNILLPACSEAARGERCLFGSATDKNYKTLTAACIADGHNIIGESPIDVNIAKQVNILVSDMGMPLDRIVINPTIGALGYGMEYAYSIMERARSAALKGDSMLAMPFICFVGQEVWKTKEAKTPEKEKPGWGALENRGPMWEFVTAVSMVQAGADILVMNHPKAVAETKNYIDSLMKR